VTGYLLVNPKSGDGGAEELLAAARERGIETHVLREGDDPAELARRADADAVGIAGGDGSLAAVAGAAAARGLPFVCVPFGTRNHFARDLGLDRDDPIAALAAFSDALERQVDLGRANGRPFVNNVSLGLYAMLVHRRERHRRRRDALARLRALGAVLARRGTDRFTVDGEPVDARVLLVSRNTYELSMLSLGERDRLDEGVLHVYASRDLLRPRWEERGRSSVVVDAAAGRVRAAIDGEPELLETPVAFSIEPGALRVLVPRVLVPRGPDA
jgi:diacylglycerol kinase family enzyme